MSELKFPLYIQDIEKCIPHRSPFLMIDRVEDLVPEEYLIAYKNVSISNPVLPGHFPGNPIYPGVLIVEGAAQAGAVLGYYSNDQKCNQCRLTEVTSARFRRAVVPGDVVRFQIDVTKIRRPFFWFNATVTVEGEMAAEMKFSALMN